MKNFKFKVFEIKFITVFLFIAIFMHSNNSYAFGLFGGAPKKMSIYKNIFNKKQLEFAVKKICENKYLVLSGISATALLVVFIVAVKKLNSGKPNIGSPRNFKKETNNKKDDNKKDDNKKDSNKKETELKDLEELKEKDAKNYIHNDFMGEVIKNATKKVEDLEAETRLKGSEAPDNGNRKDEKLEDKKTKDLPSIPVLQEQKEEQKPVVEESKVDSLNIKKPEVKQDENISPEIKENNLENVEQEAKQEEKKEKKHESTESEIFRELSEKDAGINCDINNLTEEKKEIDIKSNSIKKNVFKEQGAYTLSLNKYIDERKNDDENNIKKENKKEDSNASTRKIDNDPDFNDAQEILTIGVGIDTKSTTIKSDKEIIENEKNREETIYIKNDVGVYEPKTFNLNKLDDFASLKSNWRNFDSIAQNKFNKILTDEEKAEISLCTDQKNLNDFTCKILNKMWLTPEEVNFLATIWPALNELEKEEYLLRANPKTGLAYKIKELANIAVNKISKDNESKFKDLDSKLSKFVKSNYISGTFYKSIRKFSGSAKVVEAEEEILKNKDPEKYEYKLCRLKKIAKNNKYNSFLNIWNLYRIKNLKGTLESEISKEELEEFKIRFRPKYGKTLEETNELYSRINLKEILFIKDNK